MAGYKPLKIAGFETGLVQEREEFLLVEDAFPVLENAYVWREKILKKRGKESYGRLRRSLTSQSLAVTNNSLIYVDNDILTTIKDLTTAISLRTTEPNASIQLLSLTITFDIGGASETILSDTLGTGALSLSATNALNANGGAVNYGTGQVYVNFDAAIAAGLSVEIDVAYFPSLPCMGLRKRELNTINSEELIAFDTKYAYTHGAANWSELVPGTQWRGDDHEFFWSDNFWVNATNNKLFWVTNFTSGATADPIRYYDGVSWTDFAPLITTLDTLYQARVILPFRGRLLALNTYEGTTAGGIVNSRKYAQRIRWSQIGNPILADSWKQDIRGKGSYLDIPTGENIVSAGFVRDNLVIYCERSTWQLRYTGRDISPFQIERVNSELGCESTFSSVQFDKSLVGVGDKRIVSCNSFDSEPIDIKIPDLAFQIENENDGKERVHGIRDIVPRLAYWTYTSSIHGEFQGTFPNKTLLYNYENQSWAIFKDSVTCFGYTWYISDPTWEDYGEIEWGDAGNITWTSRQAESALIMSGNQQGYTHIMNRMNANQESLYITDITGNTTSATTLTIINHNLDQGDIIEVVNIPTGTPFATELNDKVFSVTPIDADTVELYSYDDTSGAWSTPRLDAALVQPLEYIGYGEVKIRDNFRVVTKKFHHMDEGQKIQVGYIDVLLDSTEDGKITANFYVDYKDTAVNKIADTFFNRIISTSSTAFNIQGASRYWHRIHCPVRGNFVQTELTLSNSQMNDNSAVSDIFLHAMIVWERTGGRLTI